MVKADGVLGVVRAATSGLERLSGGLREHVRRAEAHRHAVAYVAGLLGDMERKNGWQLAEHGGYQHPRTTQRVLDRSVWDVDAVQDDLREQVVEALGDPDGVLVVDETGFLKEGVKSCGVARQYSGTAGRIENCQIGVFLGYAPVRGGGPGSTGPCTCRAGGPTIGGGVRRPASPRRSSSTPSRGWRWT